MKKRETKGSALDMGQVLSPDHMETTFALSLKLWSIRGPSSHVLPRTTIHNSGTIPGTSLIREHGLSLILGAEDSAAEASWHPALPGKTWR